MDSRVQRLEMGLFHIGHSHGCSSCPARKCTEFLQVQSSHRQSIHFRGQRNRKLPTQTDQRLLIVTSLFLRALNVYASTAASFLQEGDAAVANGDYTTAVRHYSSFIDLNPAAAIGYSKRSAVYVQQKTYKEAIYDLDKAVEVDPVFVQGYLNRGRLFRQSCRFEEAEKDFNKVIEINPEHTTSRKELAQSLQARESLWMLFLPLLNFAQKFLRFCAKFSSYPLNAPRYGSPYI